MTQQQTPTRTFEYRTIGVVEYLIPPAEHAPLYKVHWNLTYPDGSGGFVIGVGETLELAQADVRARLDDICNRLPGDGAL